MYSFFDNSKLIDSSKNYSDLATKRYNYILDLLANGYEYLNNKDNKNDKNDNNNDENDENDSIIKLIKDDNIKKLSILWSGNTIKNTIQDQNKNEGIVLNNNNDFSNNNINKDDLLSSLNINESSLKIDDLSLKIDDLSLKIDDSSLKADKSSLKIDEKQELTNKKNQIINNILYYLNNTEFNSAYIPPKIIAEKIKNLLEDKTFMLYRQQLLNAILDGRNNQEIIIPIKSDMDNMNIYTFCYILILREYQFNLNVDDDLNLHIQINW